jgi:hypothetical protein
MVWTSVVRLQTGSEISVFASDTELWRFIVQFVSGIRLSGVPLASHCVVAVCEFVSLAPPALICGVYAAIEDLLERVWKWLSRVCATDRSGRNFPHLPTDDAFFMERNEAPATSWHSCTLTEHLILTLRIPWNERKVYIFSLLSLFK